MARQGSGIRRKPSALGSRLGAGQAFGQTAWLPGDQVCVKK